MQALLAASKSVMVSTFRKVLQRGRSRSSSRASLLQEEGGVERGREVRGEKEKEKEKKSHRLRSPFQTNHDVISSRADMKHQPLVADMLKHSLTLATMQAEFEACSLQRMSLRLHTYLTART